jgi:Xaa-Pro aminopeptidase
MLASLDSFSVFAGVPHPPGEENSWFLNEVRIYQEPSILYLTGINQTGIILVLNPHASDKEVLFIPMKDRGMEFWNGEQFGYPKELLHKKGPTKILKPQKVPDDVKHLQLLTGIKDIRPIKEFKHYFKRLVAKSRLTYAYSFYHNYPSRKGSSKKIISLKTDYNWTFTRKLRSLAASTVKNGKGNRAAFEIRSIADRHLKLRLPLEKHQLEDVRQAVRKANQGFRKTLKDLTRMKTEHDLACLLNYNLKKRSVFGLSFPLIIASGRNATTLHYVKNDDVIQSGSLVLMDFGLKYGTVHSDISRTVPASGRFNPLQALLYRIVLDAQRENQKNVRSGITIRELNKKVWTYIEEKLKKEFFARGGKAKRRYTLQPHGVSHLMGIQVHDGDPFRLYQDTALEKDWQISSEPGIYGHFAINLKGRTYSEYLGIRVEDNLLVQEHGCINLTRSVPSRIREIERLILGAG